MLRVATGTSSASTRIASWSALVAVEFLAARLFAPLPDVWNLWPVVGVAHITPKIFLLSVAIFAILSWPKRAAIVSAFNREADDFHSLATAAISATATLIAFVVRSQLAQAAPSGGDVLAYVYAAAILVAVATLVLVVAPLSFWRTIVQLCRFELILAIGFGAFGFIAGAALDRRRGDFFSEDTWAQLSDATLQLSYWILQLFDHDAFMDPSTRVLGAKDFSVRVFAACSGYEGMILISVFFVGYVLIFRRSLRFPNVLVLFPLAMGTIWLLNGLRIALLVFIGANLSPNIALGGFHSQFGWISFLLVSITIMTSARRIAFFGTGIAPALRSADAGAPRRTAEFNPALLYLAPFIALMAAQIMSRAAAPHDYLLYPVKVVAVGVVLYALRDVYRRMWSAPAFSSIFLGAVAGLIWIMTDPGASIHVPLEASLSEFTPIALSLWLVFRAIGTIIMVPIAEELAFRGYLYRVMQSSRFETVDFRAFGFVALCVSSGFFGLMHDRWLAASLAGVLYALVMIRRGRIADAVAAHMATNAVIFAWAVFAGQWSLL